MSMMPARELVDNAAAPPPPQPCALLPACEGCGAVDDLALVTVDLPILGTGAVCMTLCASCADAGDLPDWPVATAVHRVCEHLAHLTDDLVALIR